MEKFLKVLAPSRYIIYMSLFPPFPEHRELENVKFPTLQKCEHSKNQKENHTVTPNQH